MISYTTERFWAAYVQLPAQARAAYQLFRANPQHPGLRFHRVNQTLPLYAVRIGEGYRALGMLDGNEITWVWIGTHADNDRLLRQW